MTTDFNNCEANDSDAGEGVWCWVRFRKTNGTTVRARAWAEGDSEPDAWAEYVVGEGSLRRLAQTVGARRIAD